MNIQNVYLSKLIEAIKLLAAPSQIQLSSFPDRVCKPDEIALTFDEFASKVDECQLISNTIKNKIKELNDLFDCYFTKMDWTEESIIHSEKWESIRNLALELLDFMGIPYTDPSLFWIRDVN